MALVRPSVRALPRQFLMIHRNSSTRTSATQNNTKQQQKKGPLSGTHSTDLGARVIKIERPRESLALDVKNPRDHRILMRLLSRADVLVQNLAPGASARLNLSFADLLKKHPSLIICNISGYGPDGPYRDKKAYDLLIQSEAGLLSVTGTATQPAKVGISIADICAGSYAYSSILAALSERAKDLERRGCNIDISMLESMVEWMGFPMYYTYGDQPGPTPAGASHAAIYPYGPFETGKGTVMLGIQNEREWAKFCEMVLEKPEMVTDERFCNNSLRVKNRVALRETICKIFAAYSAEGILRRLDEAGIANASVNDMQGVWNHPQLRARQRWT
ncbi:hypothetical protein CNMCM8980_008614 [Aspergillus fumigatiaffinis]|uniref:CAIB/BAIF family enzyme n=1 Tax=Aspergillus fumigatiaffinis TaxID=340414 RepID=A0A8H4H416_9EURO|nr:hypothetical protein CNMCM6805_008499 [Aspergillus fumigatiaffinis]KAF4246413.1 hypothetical protein CNMCM8980_008614 [Aspergillus fumigatiaffinis]